MKTILLILLNLQLIYATTFDSTISDYDRNSNIPVYEHRVDYTTETHHLIQSDDMHFFITIGLLFLWMTYDIFINPTIKENRK